MKKNFISLFALCAFCAATLVACGSDDDDFGVEADEYGKTAKDLEKYGVTQIFSNPNPVAVTPVMRSVVKSTGDTDDWMARLGTTYLKTRLTEDAQHGAKSNLHSTNPIPGVAKGVEFGNYFEPGVKRTGGYTY